VFGESTLLVGSLGQSQAYQYDTGSRTDGGWLQAYHYAFSDTNPFNLGLSYDQQWSRNLITDDVGVSYLSTYGSDGLILTFTDDNPETIALNASSVPEPSSLALFAAGMLGLGFTRRFNLK
jgi:hypothetical protein